MSFVPIAIDAYVSLHVRGNPDESARELRRRIVAALEAKRAGRTCECGEPIWGVGSATAGMACFTCITMESVGGAVSQSPYIVVADVDKHYARAVAAGAEIVIGIRDEDYGGRDYSCRDPEGHVWNFGSYDPWASA